MEKHYIAPTHLIELKCILKLMVSQQRISLKERRKILTKAGMVLREDGKWEDEMGVIYSD